VITGDDIDLTKLPFPLWNIGDGGRFSTAGLVIASHPEFGWNVAYHRSQIFGATEMGMSTVPDHQLALALDEARAEGRRVEAAVLLGARPSIAIAAGSDFSLGDCELDIAGALEGRAIGMARCITVDVPVPEDTEIVIEGYFSGEMRDEGPFVEFTGSQTPVRKAPVSTVTAITHRMNPICHGVFAGKPPCETTIIWRELEEAEAFATLRRRYPMLVGLHRPPSLSRDFIGILQVKSGRVRPGFVRNLLLASAAVMHRAKYVIAVDDDIDIYSLNDVMWAVGTRCDPKADIVIVPGTMTARVDPSSGGLSGKVFMDATKKEGFRGSLPSFPAEATARAKALLSDAIAETRPAD
jgi:UbiD family decarboxylase